MLNISIRIVSDKDYLIGSGKVNKVQILIRGFPYGISSVRTDNLPFGVVRRSGTTPDSKPVLDDCAGTRQPARAFKHRKGRRKKGKKGKENGKKYYSQSE